jgi:hypothetical protein
VLLHVGACGDQPLAHQWFFNDAALPNETNSVLQLANVQLANGRRLLRRSSPTALVQVTSQVAQIAVGAMPVITAIRRTGGPIPAAPSHSVSGATGSGLTYQWRLNAAAIPGATDSVLVLADVTSADAGHYSVLVSGSGGGVASQAAQLVVTPALQILAQPQGRSVLPGSNVVFSVSAQGAGTLSYQWFFQQQCDPGCNLSVLHGYQRSTG